MAKLEGGLAKQRDGLLSRGMSGEVEGWVAKQRDGGLNRGMGG